VTISDIVNKLQPFNEQFFSNRLILDFPVQINKKLTRVGARVIHRRRREVEVLEIAPDSLYRTDLDSIIVHELIHVYIAQQGIKDNAMHGRQFKRLMNKINLMGTSINVEIKADGKNRGDGKYPPLKNPKKIVIVDSKNGFYIVPFSNKITTGELYFERTMRRFYDWCTINIGADAKVYFGSSTVGALKIYPTKRDFTLQQVYEADDYKEEIMSEVDVIYEVE